MGRQERIMVAFSISAFPAIGEIVAAAVHALGWPARVLEARETRARLAELSERELHDIGGVRQDVGDWLAAETPAERQARRIAVRAWYGHDAEAA